MNGKAAKILRQYAYISGMSIDEAKKKFSDTAKPKRADVLEMMRASIRLRRRKVIDG